MSDSKKISNASEVISNVILVLILLLSSTIMGTAIYYNETANSSVENELRHIEKLNNELASETIHLRNELKRSSRRIEDVATGVVNISEEITSVSGRITDSEHRVQDVRNEIGKAGTDLERAELIIEQCQEILEEITKEK